MTLFLVFVYSFFFSIASIYLLLVSLDGGPVLFLQQRVGLGGKLFYILKFRSMNVAKHPELLLTVGKDKRITRVGIFCVTSSLMNFLNLLMSCLEI